MEHWSEVNKNDGTSLPKDSKKQKPDSASAGVASEDQLHSSGEENSTNEESEEDQSSGNGTYTHDQDTENYADSDNADLENETDYITEPSPPHTRSRSKKGT